MKKNQKELIKATAAGAAGAAVGAGTFATIGGVGLAMGGTAVGVTLAPFAVIGAGVGLVGYGCYWLGKQVGTTSGPGGDEPPGSAPGPTDGGPK